jgi:hypothetical protein
VAFLDGYRDFPEPILRKRQNELQRLVDNSIAFRKELKAWLVQAKDSLFAPSRAIVDVALEKVCVACNIDYAIDVDVVAYAYINPNKAVDITRMLLDAALNPEKPVTALDGYDECLKFFNKDAEPVIGSDAVKSVGETILVPETEAAITEDVVDGAVVTDEAGNYYHHTHAVFSYKDGSRHCMAAGHIRSITVLYTVEIELRPVTGGAIKRKHDAETGTGFWDFV